MTTALAHRVWTASEIRKPTQYHASQCERSPPSPATNTSRRNVMFAFIVRLIEELIDVLNFGNTISK